MMASPRAKGRMLNRDISNSKGFGKLTAPAAVLFTMLIPHYTPYGKMNGDPGYLKGEVCPRIPYLTVANIPKYMKEITEHTSVKWFQYDERWWIHSIKFISEHQHINMERIGPDLLPNYSVSSQGVVTSEVEVKDLSLSVSLRGPEVPPGGVTPDPPASPPSNGRFKIPTIEEVAAYAKARGGIVDPVRFHAHYTANGWRVGKNPMRNWKAAVVTWERN